MITYPLPRKRHRKPLIAPTTPPPAPVAAIVVRVTGSFGSADAVWTFDRPVVILPGATWEMFQLTEDGGLHQCLGTLGTQLTATTIRVTMDTAPQDLGNQWFWGLDAAPAKVKTTEGGNIRPGSGGLVVT